MCFNTSIRHKRKICLFAVTFYKKKIRVGLFVCHFFFFLSVCVKAFFFPRWKNIQVSTFMLSIYSCLPCSSSLKKERKKQTKQEQKTALVQKIMGQSEEFFFFFRNWQKKNNRSGRFFEGQSGYGKQTILFMPYNKGFFFFFNLKNYLINSANQP